MLTAFSVIRFWLPCLSGYQKRQMSSKSRKFLWLRRIPKKQIGLTILVYYSASFNKRTHTHTLQGYYDPYEGLAFRPEVEMSAEEMHCNPGTTVEVFLPKLVGDTEVGGIQKWLLTRAGTFNWISACYDVN